MLIALYSMCDAFVECPHHITIVLGMVKFHAWSKFINFFLQVDLNKSGDLDTKQYEANGGTRRLGPDRDQNQT